MIQTNNIFQEGFEDASFFIEKTSRMGIIIEKYLGHSRKLKEWGWMKLSRNISGYKEEGVGPKNRVRL